MEPTAVDLRASDAEREWTITELRGHAAAGRLTVDELAERTDAALAARTRAELTGLTADLPRSRPRRARTQRRGGEWRTYTAVMVLLVAIWALTGAGYAWFVWPALGWGIALAMPGSMCHGTRGRYRRLPA